MLTLQRVLQAGGIGRSAMIQTERIAASPPFNATVVALDTMRKEFETSESHLKQIFDDKGLQRPREVRSTEEWYIRQGYTVMEGPEIFRMEACRHRSGYYGSDDIYEEVSIVKTGR